MGNAILWERWQITKVHGKNNTNFESRKKILNMDDSVSMLVVIYTGVISEKTYMGYLAFIQCKEVELLPRPSVFAQDES